MTLGETITRLQELQKSWTDDTDVFIHADLPLMYALQEVYEDEDSDCIVLATHPFAAGE